MPCCAAIDCSNRAEKGYLLKAFPTDPQRRKEWLIKMKRANWMPTKYSRICEVHFEPCMWEKTREDGSRKLKTNAVPTLFAFVQEKRKRKPPKKRPSPTREPLVAEQLSAEICIPSTSGTPTVSQEALSEDSAESSITSWDTIARKDCLLLQRNLKRCEIKCRRLLMLNQKYRKSLRTYKCRARSMDKTLRERCDTDENLKLLKSIFNDDQISALKQHSNRFRQWSNSTIKRALQLKFACGDNGYKELLRHKMPLPSLRTLRRRLQNLPFDSRVQHEVFESLKIKVTQCKEEHEKYCVIVLDEKVITS